MTETVKCAKESIKIVENVRHFCGSLQLNCVKGFYCKLSSFKWGFGQSPKDCVLLDAIALMSAKGMEAQTVIRRMHNPNSYYIK